MPQATLSGVTTDPLIGQTLNFVVTFDNTAVGGGSPDNIGYGPFLDLYLPAAGADGDDGIGSSGNNDVTATYLGASVTKTEIVFPPGGTVNHPYAVNTDGTPQVITGNPGDKLVALLLPFGSFAPDQPPADIDVTAPMSNLADVDTGMTIRARAGFQYGTNPLNDYCCGDPPILNPSNNTATTWDSGSGGDDATVTPRVWTVDKSYEGPEDEIATGPNYQGNTGNPAMGEYTITVTIVPGQSVTGLSVTDTLPDNVQYVSTASSPAGSVNGASTANTATPGGVLIYDFSGSVSGTATLTVYFYVGEDDAGGLPIISPGTAGATSTAINEVAAQATWVPLDPRDPPATPTVTCPSCPGHSLTARSIATQKGVSVIGGGNPTPGATLEYTLDFQISDYFAFDQLVLEDWFGDGQDMDTGFTPTLEVTENGTTTGPSGFDAGNYTVDAINGITGETRIEFRISDELVTAGRSDDMLGGLVAPAGGGALGDGSTTGQIVFRTTVRDDYQVIFPSGEASINQGDTLDNQETITGRLLDPLTCTIICLAYLGDPTTSDSSSAPTTIPTTQSTKEIYAINGSAPSGSPPQIGPGDEVTFRIQYPMLTGDFENLTFTDFFPLPVFDADDPDLDGSPDATWPEDLAGNPTPALGQWQRGPADTQSALPGVPAVTAISDGPSNSVTWDFGTYADPTNTPVNVDILFTIEVSNEPFTDQLYLTNQARQSDQNTQSTASNSDNITQVILTEPLLVTNKTVVATDNGSATYSPSNPPGAPLPFNAPGTSGSRWTGTLTDSDLPFDSNISNINGGDAVSFAIVIQNNGSSPKGAFDMQLRDELQADFDVPSIADLNLRVAYGDGTELVHNPAGGSPGWIGLGSGCTGSWPGDPCGPDGIADTADDIFGAGIEIVDPGLAVGACEGAGHAQGHNLVIVTYDLDVSVGVAPNTTVTNTGHLMQYAGEEGGPNFLPEDLTDQASVIIAPGSIDKSTVTSTDLTVGDIFTQQYSVTVPPYTTLLPRVSSPTYVVIRDTYPTGILPINAGNDAVNADGDPTLIDGGICSAAFDSPASAQQGSSHILNFQFQTVDNSANSSACTFTFQQRFVVADVDTLASPNQRAFTPPPGPNNATDTAQLRYSDGTSNINGPSNNATVTVEQPIITTTKTVAAYNPASGRPPVQGSDIITYQVVLANTAGNGRTAYEVTLEDAIPNHMDYQTGTASVTAHSGGVLINGGAASAAPFALPDPGGGTAGPTTLSFTDWDGGGGTQDLDLPDGASITIQYQVTVRDTIAAGGTITNTADADWTSQDGTTTHERLYVDSSDANLDDGTTTDTSSVAVAVVAPPLGKQALGDRVPTIGQEQRYRITLTIPANTVAIDLQVEDTLNDVGGGADGLQYVDADADVSITIDGVAVPGGDPRLTPTVSGTNDGTADVTVTWDLGDFDPAISTDRIIVLDFDALVVNTGAPTNLDGEVLQNDVVTRWEDAVGVMLNQSNSTTDAEDVIAVAPALEVVKAAADPFISDDEIVTFTITITNVGRGTASNVDVEDLLPLGFTFVDSSSGGSDATFTVAAIPQGTITPSVAIVGSQQQLTFDSNATLAGITFPGTWPGAVPPAPGEELVLTFTAQAPNGIADSDTFTNTGSTNVDASRALDAGGVAIPRDNPHIPGTPDDTDSDDSDTEALVAGGYIFGSVVLDPNCQTSSTFTIFNGQQAITGATVTLTAVTALPAPPPTPNLGPISPDANGVYDFSNIPPGTYDVSVAYPSAPPTFVPLTASTVTVGTSPGTSSTVNFGAILGNTIVGNVYRDDNGNGVRDAGEPGLPGVQITLYDDTGVQVGAGITPTNPIFTDANGDYSFDPVIVSATTTFTVVESDPSGYNSITSNSQNVTVVAADDGACAVFGDALEPDDDDDGGGGGGSSDVDPALLAQAGPTPTPFPAPTPSGLTMPNTGFAPQEPAPPEAGRFVARVTWTLVVAAGLAIVLLRREALVRWLRQATGRPIQTVMRALGLGEKVVEPLYGIYGGPEAEHSNGPPPASGPIKALYDQKRWIGPGVGTMGLALFVGLVLVSSRAMPLGRIALLLGITLSGLPVLVGLWHSYWMLVRRAEGFVHRHGAETAIQLEAYQAIHSSASRRPKLAFGAAVTMLAAVLCVSLVPGSEPGLGGGLFGGRAASIEPDNSSNAEDYNQTPRPMDDPRLEGIQLSIPRLNLNTEVLGVYRAGNTWDIGWLTTQVGYMQGTAWPGTLGNMVLSGHVSLRSGAAGPFAGLATLKYGDQIFIEQQGVTQIYEVQDVIEVRPTEMQYLLPTDDATLTLITCARYDPRRGFYTHRILVQARLVSTQSAVAQTAMEPPL